VGPSGTFSRASHSEAATEKAHRRRVENLTRRCNVLALNFPKEQEHFMSQHRSLKGASTITAKRNVLKRFERVELLKKRGQFKEGQKVLGLPKTKPDI
jgi:small basic protein (TIGR04137 family)